MKSSLAVSNSPDDWPLPLDVQVDLIVGRMQMLEHKHTYDILADGRKVIASTTTNARSYHVYIVLNLSHAWFLNQVIASTTTVCQIFETPEACMASQQLDDEDEDGRERFDDGEGEGPERACLIEMVSYYTTVEGQPPEAATVAARNPPGFEETMVLSFWMGPPGAPATRPI